MKRSVYLDTTIPSYLFDERPEIKTYVDVTNKWWSEEGSNFDIWTSDETIAEISQGDYPKKDEILKFISGVQKKLYDEVGHNLEKYVKRTHEIVEETAKNYDLNFHYGRRNVANSL